MRARRHEQLTEALIASEAEFLAILEPLLPDAANLGTPIFLNTANLPELYGGKPYEVADRLHALATTCLELRDTLTLPREGSMAQMFLDACDEYVDLSNAHRRGPRRLARALLDRVQQRVVEHST